METKAKMTNGVNIDRLVETIGAIKETPSLAKFQFRTKNNWIDGGHNRSTIKAFYGAGQEDTTREKPFIMDADEPDVLLGTDKGANPVEYVLHALAGCLTTSMVYHAAARGIQIDEVESTFEGELDLHGFLGLSEEIRQGYNNIKVKFDIKGEGLTEEQKREVLSFAKYSPVHDIVSNPVPVSIKLV